MYGVEFKSLFKSQAVKDCIWLFEQEQALGFSSVSTNIRMTVIKLKSGGLWVHAPIAPTKECIQVVFSTFVSIFRSTISFTFQSGLLFTIICLKFTRVLFYPIALCTVLGRFDLNFAQQMLRPKQVSKERTT